MENRWYHGPSGVVDRSEDMVRAAANEAQDVTLRNEFESVTDETEIPRKLKGHD